MAIAELLAGGGAGTGGAVATGAGGEHLVADGDRVVGTGRRLVDREHVQEGPEGK
ncbi:MAG: hypothetical protein IPG97_16970 [Microthrixaceae bacterium]|nr:hypothetical protein [Microthrixaceae bacterium]